MKISVGDIVETIDDSLKGKVISIDNHILIIETEDGFEINATPNEVIRLDENSKLTISNAEIYEALSEKASTNKRKISSKREKIAPPMEVDLHIGQLTTSYKGMSNYDMLTIQLDTAKRQLEFAIKKRIQRIVFIHGVGEGVLKSELHYLFGRYDNLKYYDADYQKYGLGATEVYIFQN